MHPNESSKNIVQFPLWAVGFMSGTSLDGVDVAIIKTDGHKIYEKGPTLTYLYENIFKAKLSSVLGQKEITPLIMNVCEELMNYHLTAFKLLDFNGKIDLVSVHGQTLFHEPKTSSSLAKTWQLVEPSLLHNFFNCPIIYDLRGNDIRHGGHGAPLVPIFHETLMNQHEKPVAVVNIGGVANITLLENDTIYAGDTGPGMALINDYCIKNLNLAYDHHGNLAQQGICHHNIVKKWLSHSYFSEPFPKSLDRNTFASFLDDLCDLLHHDALATLSLLTAKGICHHLPHHLKTLYVTGGGRHNNAIMKYLHQNLQCPIKKIEDIGYDGDFIEAQAWAFLGARSFYNLPLSFPTTTGVAYPMIGGEIFNQSQC